jgi:hypothetical protein
VTLEAVLAWPDRLPGKEAEMGDDETNGLNQSADEESAGQPEEETLEGIAPPADEGTPVTPTGWLGSTTPMGAPLPPPPPPRPSKAPLMAVVLAVVAAGAMAVIIAFAGSSSKDPASASSPTPAPSLLDPTGLTASAQPFSVRLSWTQPEGGTPIQTYVVYRNNSLVDEIPASSTTFDDDSVDPGKKYTYELEAKAGELQTRFIRVKVSTPTPPLGEARLEGDFNVKFTFVSSRGFQSTTDNFTAGWHFKPKCKAGACDVTWTDLTEKTLKGTLNRKRDAYSGKDSGVFFATCGAHQVTSALTITFNVTKAKGQSGKWLATRIEGTVGHFAASQLGCVSSSAKLDISGNMLS